MLSCRSRAISQLARYTLQFPPCGYVTLNYKIYDNTGVAHFVDDIDTKKSHTSQHVARLPACDSSLFGELGFKWSSNRAEVPREDNKC